MFELVILQDTFVNTVWGTIATFGTGITIVSGLALYWIRKLHAKLKNSKNETAQKWVNVLEGYIMPALQQGEKIAEITTRQEVKAKQFGEILYGMFPEKSAEIKGKYEVKLVNLTSDVDKAIKGTVEYNEKVKALEALIQEMKGSVGTVSPAVLKEKA